MDYPLFFFPFCGIDTFSNVLTVLGRVLAGASGVINASRKIFFQMRKIKTEGSTLKLKDPVATILVDKVSCFIHLIN